MAVWNAGCHTVGQTSDGYNNPDPALRSRALIGLQVVREFSRVNESLWAGGGDNGGRPGRIYVPENGDALGDDDNADVIRLVDSDSLAVSIQDCTLTGLFNSTWRRVR